VPTYEHNPKLEPGGVRQMQRSGVGTEGTFTRKPAGGVEFEVLGIGALGVACCENAIIGNDIKNIQDVRWSCSP